MNIFFKSVFIAATIAMTGCGNLANGGEQYLARVEQERIEREDGYYEKMTPFSMPLVLEAVDIYKERLGRDVTDQEGFCLRNLSMQSHHRAKFLAGEFGSNFYAILDRAAKRRAIINGCTTVIIKLNREAPIGLLR